MKSIFKLKPDDANDKGASFDKHKKFMVSGVRELAKKHNTPAAAVWFFMDMRHAFPADPAEDKKGGNILWACDNESKWKKHYNEKVGDLKRVAMGSCFVEANASGNPETLVLQIARGKAKNKEINKKFRAITKKLKMTIRISRGPEAQEDPDPSDAENSQADGLEDLQTDIKELYSELGKLAKPLNQKQLPEAAELQKAITQFQDLFKGATDARTKQQFTPFATQVANWAKALQDAVSKVPNAGGGADAKAVTGAFPELWKKIENVYVNGLQNGAAWTGTQAQSNATIQKSMELRQFAQQLEKEYLKLAPQKQSTVTKQMSSTRDWVNKCMAFLRQQPKDKLQQANDSAKDKAAGVADRLKSAIMGLTKKINVQDGIQFSETADAQRLQKGIEDYRIALQNAPREAQAQHQPFFDQVRKLRNKLTAELGKTQQQAQANMPQLIEQQQADLQRAEALAQQLDIFNIHL